ATGRVRKTLGFSGFLVVQTFNSQVIIILLICNLLLLFYSSIKIAGIILKRKPKTSKKLSSLLPY
ncbi:MAG: hypothetical protein K1W38_17880, partial [Lachnospiraceae bacterium]